MAAPIDCQQLRAWHEQASRVLEQLRREYGRGAAILNPLAELEAALHEAWVDAAHAEARLGYGPRP